MKKEFTDWKNWAEFTNYMNDCVRRKKVANCGYCNRKIQIGELALIWQYIERVEKIEEFNYKLSINETNYKHYTKMIGISCNNDTCGNKYYEFLNKKNEEFLNQKRKL